MNLTREAILDGAVERMLVEDGVPHPMLSAGELLASRRATFGPSPVAREVWVFAYGSLMWNPAFHYAERRVVRIHGYHRRFCLWSFVGRGSAERPGLTLGLERGGSCAGIAFRIAAEEAEAELEVIWRREMVTGAYHPRWMVARGEAGAVRAVSFVINRDHVRYAGLLPEDRVAEAIMRGQGRWGSCRDYLLETQAHLEEIGLTDRPLARLARRVREGGSS